MAQISAKQAAGFLVAGAMVGAAVALIYAPQSGAQTKEDIRKFGLRAVDRIDALQGCIRDDVTEWVDGMAKVVKEGVDRGKKLSAEGYERVLQSFDDAKNCVEEGRTRIEQLIKSV